MADPVDLILPMLREMRAGIDSLQTQMLGRFELVDRRFDKLEKALDGYRHALAGDSLLSKLVTGEFEERIEALERRMRELEESK